MPCDIARINAAKAEAFSTRGPNKGKLKAKCPPMGSDAAAFWQAAMLICNPFKVGMCHLMFMDAEQRAFFEECRDWCEQQHSSWKLNADKDRSNLSKLGVW